MSMKINPPDFSKCATYERFKQELLAWESVTELPKKKRGIAVALTLPTDHESGIREKVFDELSLEDDLNNDTGFTRLITFLDKHLAKDDLTDCLEKFEDFEDFGRSSEQTITDYISKFDQKYNKLTKLRITLPQEILAFKLLRRAKLSKEERLLVLTGMDYEDKATLYEQAKKSLKKFKGEHASTQSKASVAIKLEPTFLAEHEEALMAAGYVHKSKSGSARGGRSKTQWRGNSGGGYSGAYSGANSGAYGGTYSGGGQYGGYSGSGDRDGTRSGGGNRGGNGSVPGGRAQSYSGKHERHVNPSGPDGRFMRCRACGSFRHLVADCPDSWENMASVNVVGDDWRGTVGIGHNSGNSEKIVLFTGYDKGAVAQLGSEARNCAILDCACSSTVCGQTWLDCYIDSLHENDRNKVIIKPGEKVFKFGGGEVMKSKTSVEIPAILAGQEVTIKTDVVDSELPLLLSVNAMKKAKVKLDLEHDTAEILGVSMALNHTSSGHYCVPIDRTQENRVEEVCAVKLEDLSQPELVKTLIKLHRQFAHPSKKKLIALLKDAGVWRQTYDTEMSKIYDECQVCKVYTKTPPRPVVSLPMASKFNQIVSMDLKKWDKEHILHMIDMWSRFTVSVFIKRKKPSVVVDKIMMHWVGAGFGVMEAIMSDNGGEFSSEETREVASILNITVHTTGAECPFQNGLCERVHHVTDVMLTKLIEDFPGVPKERLLCWANMARNGLQMWNGFSSYQLVFGCNPNIPNIMTDRLPALEGATSSQVLAQHLNALHAARKAFIESEADERIRRALRSKVRASEQVFTFGDLVYYKREGHDRWLGPGKVMFQDGRVVFVRHGGAFVRVSPNRLIMVESGNAAQMETVAPESSDKQKMTSDVKQTNSDVEKSGKASLDMKREEKCAEMKELLGDSNSAEDEQDGGADGPAIFQDEQHDDNTPGKDSNACAASGDKIVYKLDETDNWTKATVISKAGKSTGRNRKWVNIEEDGGKKMSIDLGSVTWEKINDGDDDGSYEEVNIVMIPKTRHKEPDCIRAKETELQKLKDFKTFEEVADRGQSRISTTWVLWWKGEEVRARLVARGFEEQEGIRSDSPTIGKSAMRVVLTVAASRGWRVKTTDIKSAFLQGNPLERDVFLTPPREAVVSSGHIWRLKHCLYGLNDAARQFYNSVVEELRRLGCTQSQLDPALFYLTLDGCLVGMIASHIDDFLHAGTQQFEEQVMTRLRKRFLAGKLEEGHFKYVGFAILQQNDGIELDQTGYTNDIEVQSITPQRAAQKQETMTAQELTQLRSLAGKLNWAVQGSRPDLAFELIELSMKFRKGQVSDLIKAIKAVRKLKEGVAKVFFPQLGAPSCWKLLVFSDASHANLSDGVSSMGAHIVLLVGDANRCCPLSWHAGKIKRVVRSTIAAEALSLQEGLEDGYYLRTLLEELLDLPEKSIPLVAYIDNQSVVEAVHSTKLVDDKRLRLDLGAIKESFQTGEVSAIRWCPGAAQIADCMTKRGAAGHHLLSILQTGQLKLPDWSFEA